MMMLVSRVAAALVVWRAFCLHTVSLVGVLTETKIMSAAAISASMSLEKKRFFPRDASTTSCSPGS